MNEWRYAIGFQSLGQPHECKLYTSKTENIHYYVQFWCRFSWFAALFDNILPLSVEVSQKIGTKMEKIRLWNHVRGRTMWMLAWADETRKINNIKIPFSISRFNIRVEVMWDRGLVAAGDIGSKNLPRQKDQQNIILCISSDAPYIISQ